MEREDAFKLIGLILFVIGLLWLVNYIDPTEHRQETVNGHLYEVFDQYKNDDYVHSPDCWCKKDSTLNQ